MPAPPARDRDGVARTSITIVLELDEATDRPAGSARLLGGQPRMFHGWLGLAEAIDTLARVGSDGGASEHSSKADLPRDHWKGTSAPGD